MNTELWQQHSINNALQTVLLLAIMMLFLALLGWLLWGVPGVLFLFVIGLLLGFIHPSISPYLVMRLYCAQRLNYHQLPALFQAVDILSQRAELPNTPTLFYIPSRMINAFAMGSPNKSVIAVTDGLLRSLTLRESVSVIAHEISHIHNRDMGVMGLADLFSRMTSILSLIGQILFLFYLPLFLIHDISINWFALLLLILAPHISTLAQLGLSRTREYEADLNAAYLTADPEGLATALVKIDQLQGGWLEQLIFPGRKNPDPSLLRTHPPTTERVKRLMSLSDTYRHSQIIFPDNFNQIKIGIPVIKRHPGWHINGLWH